MDPKKAIIVGATSGIGREIASIYVTLGWKVAITGRRNHLLEEQKARHPEQISTACFDVTGTGHEQLIANLIAELGGLDLFIYNAGFGEPSLPLDAGIEKLTTQTNVNGFIEIVPYVFNYFVQQGHGQIAITSSIAALRGNSWAPSYSASKAFLSNYAESLNLKAKKLKKDIVVTDIKPGFVKTKMAKGNAVFWAAPPQKAAKQIVTAIEKRKRIAYITKRWRLIAWIMKRIPYWLYKQLG